MNSLTQLSEIDHNLEAMQSNMCRYFMVNVIGCNGQINLECAEFLAHLLFTVTPIVGVYYCSMFCCTLLYVHSSFAIILMGKRELVTLLSLSSWCLVYADAQAAQAGLRLCCSQTPKTGFLALRPK